MKIYTVKGIHRIDYDFSIEFFKLGCFKDRDNALRRAKEAFEKAKAKDFAEDIETYSDEEECDEDELVEFYEEYDKGYHRLSFGTEERYESYAISVDEWTVED